MNAAIDTIAPSNKRNLELEVDDVMKRIAIAKIQIIFLKRKRRNLLEELHRQHLEGECEPKKRLKAFSDKRKKSKNTPLENSVKEVPDDTGKDAECEANEES